MTLGGFITARLSCYTHHVHIKYWSWYETTQVPLTFSTPAAVYVMKNDTLQEFALADHLARPSLLSCTFGRLRSSVEHVVWLQSLKWWLMKAGVLDRWQPWLSVIKLVLIKACQQRLEEGEDESRMACCWFEKYSGISPHMSDSRFIHCVQMSLYSQCSALDLINELRRQMTFYQLHPDWKIVACWWTHHHHICYLCCYLYEIWNLCKSELQRSKNSICSRSGTSCLTRFLTSPPCSDLQI